MSDTKTMTGKVEKSEAEWRKELTPMQYAVLREKATERPFSGEYEHEHRPGTYTCAGCGQTLFESDAKFDSGCGWPSFTAPALESHVDEERDISHGMIRTEVLCSKCNGHLGHVFGLFVQGEKHFARLKRSSGFLRWNQTADYALLPATARRMPFAGRQLGRVPCRLE